VPANKFHTLKAVVMSTLKAGGVMLLLDSVYLSLTKETYAQNVAAVQKAPMQVRLIGAAVCYPLLAVALDRFVLSRNGTTTDAFLLGLLLYGVYNSTNYATLSNWSGGLAVQDTIWGAVLFGLTAKLLQPSGGTSQ
jgi:uncharacterized membrane protein